MRPHFVRSPERKLQRIIRVAELAIVQFVAGVLIAIGVQGNRYQPQKDFLSILGTGQHPAPWIFNGTIMILGAALMWFFVSLAGLASRGRFGLLSCCGWGISSAAGIDRCRSLSMGSLAVSAYARISWLDSVPDSNERSVVVLGLRMVLVFVSMLAAEQISTGRSRCLLSSGHAGTRTALAKGCCLHFLLLARLFSASIAMADYSSPDV